MGSSLVVAQTTDATPGAGTGPNQAPTETIKLTKPANGQAITVHGSYTGSVFIDFSAIANEKITLVHVGEKLVILFDNQSTLTIDPFFDAMNAPLQNLIVEVAPGDDLSGSQFASTFPITTDQSVLPAAGGAGAAASGANFTGPAVDPLSVPGPLPLLGPTTLGNFVVTFTLAPDHSGATPASLTALTTSGAVDEGGLVSGSPGDLYGTGNDPGFATVATDSVAGLVDFGTSGPGPIPFQFVSAATASTWIANLGLASHGEAVDTATISLSGNIETLIASTSGAGAHEVFSLTLNESTGVWTFTLINPLDEPNPGHLTTGPAVEDVVALDLSGLVIATADNGTSVTLASDFSISVTDDVPVLTTGTQVGTVDEAGLISGTPGDFYGTGNDPGAATSISGSLATLVAFGADGPDIVNGTTVGFEFVSTSAASTWLAGLDLTSHGSAVDTATVTTAGNIETLTASAADGHEVFTLSLNESTGAWTFTLVNPFDDPNPGHLTPGPAVADSVTLDLSGLVQAVDFDGDSITLANDFTVTVTDDVPVLLTATVTGTIDEAGLTLGTPGDLYGTGNNPGAPAPISGSLATLVGFGADGPDIVNGTTVGFQFVSAVNASTWLAGLDLTSHSSAVDTATITTAGNIETLTASAADGHEVFTLSLNETTGAWTFTLINPFDDPNPGHLTPGSAVADSVTLDLSGLIQAVDFDGDSVTLANDFTVTVTDDIPVTTTNTINGNVDEGGLTSGTPGDLYGTGNDPGFATTATGSLATLVTFGADGPDIVNGATVGFQFVSAANASSWLAGLDLTSHGSLINTASIATSSGIETLTASAADGHEVFTLALNESTGAWTFTLINPLDQPIDNGENTDTINLSGLVQAVDFDGDSVTLASGFTVTVTDDVPVLTTGTQTGNVDEGGLTSGTPGDLYGTGNDPGFATTVSGSLATLVTFGADGPAAAAFQFMSQSAASSWLAGLDLTSHGSALNTASIATLSGVETLTASAADGHEVFTLALNESTGAWTFTLINPLDQPTGNGENTDTINLSGLVQAVDFDGDSVTLANDFTVTVTDDVPVLTTGTQTGSVDEGGLTSGTPGDLYGTGNDPGFATTATGSLATLVAFGADGPDGSGGAVVNGSTGAFQFVTTSAASTWLAGLDLTSHGSALNTASIATLSGVETLTASAADGHEVFTLALNESTGAWTFTLINPLDQPTGNGENTDTINLSGLVQAVDFDGDSITLANDFTVTVTDDVPLVVPNNGGPTQSSLGSVDEGGLTSGTPGDLYGTGNDPGFATTATGSLTTLVKFGADGPDGSDGAVVNGSTGAFQFVTTSAASTWLAGLDLTSHGSLINTASLSSSSGIETLTASAADGHEVFTLALNESTGAWTFTLINPLDQPSGHGENTDTIDLSGLVQVVDFDGDTATLAHDFFITVTDDVPVASAVDVTMAENANLTVTLSSGVEFSFGADGPAATGSVIFNTSGATITGPNGETFGTPTYVINGDAIEIEPGTAFAALQPGQTATLTIPYTVTDFDGDKVTSDIVDTVTANDDVPVLTTGTQTGNVDEGGLTSGTPGDLYGTGNDPGFATTVSGSLATLVTFGADGPAAAAFQFMSQSAASSWLAGLDLTSHGSALNTASIATLSGVETLTASAADGHEVFTLALNESTGAWTFTLINPLDQPTGNGENTDTINLSGLVQAVDFDGDSVTLANDFTVTVTDDVPVLTTGTQTGSVDEGGLTSGTPGDLYGTGNDPGFATTATGSLATLVAFGADGPDGSGGAVVNGSTGAFQFVTTSAASTWLAGLDLTSHGSALNTASIATLSGVETLTASAADGHEVFTLALNESTGAWTFTLINPLDQPTGNGENTDTINLSGLVQAVDFDGDSITLANDFTVTVTDDVPLVVPNNGGPTQSSLGSVDEGGLTSGTPGDLYGTGNDPGFATTATGSLTTLVKFGADGPDGSDGAVVNGSTGAFQFVTTSAASTWLAGLDLTSHGSLINTASLSSSSGIETLTASAADGHEVFTLALNESTGAWTFTLINPLDQPSGHGENTDTIDLSGLVQVVDFDGDTATLAHDFFITVTDDVPVASAVDVTMAENANLTVTLSSGVEFSFGADGPAATGSVIFNTSGATITGPNGETFGTPTYVINGDAIEIEPGTAFAALQPGQTATLTIPYTVTDFDGDKVTSDIVDTVTVSGSSDQLITPVVTIDADGTAGTQSSAGPEATAGLFSIPVLALLTSDSDTLGNSPFSFTVTGVKGTETGLALTSDHQYVLFPLNTTGSFTITVSDGTTTSTETVTVNDVSGPVSGSATNDNDVLVENLAQGQNIFGDGGNDVLVANTAGGSQLYGGDFTSPVTGGGNDLLIGSSAGDNLFAGPGNDTLWGRGGDDQLYGNTDANSTTTFLFESPNDGSATISNFDSASGQNDVIDVSASGFGGGLSTSTNVASIFATEANNLFPSTTDRFVFDTANNDLYYSPDGTTAHEILLAAVTNHSVTAGDIHIVA